MAAERMIATGRVRDNTIVLDEPPSLPQDAAVHLEAHVISDKAQKQRDFARGMAQCGFSVTLPEGEAKDFIPVRCTGQPASEIIIQERR